MNNDFYGRFDIECLEPGPERAGEYRTIFQTHRDRIIHSSAFRRLQGKTQVFLSGEYDFYRTRLTHSIEVSQIGRALCGYLKKNSPHLHDEYFIDPDLVESICLAHDLGHPPFGHAGERCLHQLMVPHGGFEGNAQTLRLLTHIIFGHNERGLNPSRALLDGVLKYKTLFRETPGAENHYLYDDQAFALDFSQSRGHSSIECQIMDWADDTAYSLNDIVDGVQAGFITIQAIERWAAHQSPTDAQSASLTELLRALRDDALERRTNRKIGLFIEACSLVKSSHPLAEKTSRYAFDLVIDPDIVAESKLYKKLAYHVVFLSPPLQHLEFKAHRVLTQLFEALMENYINPPTRPLHLLPAPLEQRLLQLPTTAEKVRALCDYLANLTDSAAARLCSRLIDPRFGGIVDLI